LILNENSNSKDNRSNLKKKYIDEEEDALIKTNNIKYLYLYLKNNSICNKEKIKKAIFNIINNRIFLDNDVIYVYRFLNEYDNVSIPLFINNYNINIGMFIKDLTYIERLEYLIYLFDNINENNNKVILDIYKHLLKKKNISRKDIEVFEYIKLCDDTYKHHLKSRDVVPKINIIKERVLRK